MFRHDPFLKIPRQYSASQRYFEHARDGAAPDFRSLDSMPPIWLPFMHERTVRKPSSHSPERLSW
jgi:hypothetical protein